MDDKERRRVLETLKGENVLRYHEKEDSSIMYLVVEGVEDDKVFGQLARPTGINAVPIEDLLKKDNLEIANWTKI